MGQMPRPTMRLLFAYAIRHSRQCRAACTSVLAASLAVLLIITIKDRR